MRLNSVQVQRVLASLLGLVVVVGGTACSGGSDNASSEFCAGWEGLAVGAPFSETNLRDFIAKARRMDEVVPESERDDHDMVFAPLLDLDPTVLDDLESGDLMWDEFGEEYLSPLVRNEDWQAANYRYTEYVMTECDLDAYDRPVTPE
jgi:hypothetical protein